MKDPSRRVPTQARSKERAERILDAAARVFTEVGFEAATTEAIAERAATSIGSVYQFFPNKQALFDAIASRYFERTLALFEQLMAKSEAMPWEKLLDEAIDAFAGLGLDHPDFRAVWMNAHRSGGWMATGYAINREFARRVELIFAAQARKLPRAKRALVATVVVESISGMLLLAAREPSISKKIVAETKVLLRRYVGPYAT